MQNNAGLLTVEEITELAEIRRKIDELQARYSQIMSKALPGGFSPVVAKSESAPAVPAAAVVPPVPAPPVASPVVVEPVKLKTQVISAAPVPVAAVPPAPAAPVSVPVPPSAVPPSSGGKDNLKDAVVAVLKTAGQPLNFEQIFAKLVSVRAPMPHDKPKLALRKILYNKVHFTISKNGTFETTGNA